MGQKNDNQTTKKGERILQLLVPPGFHAVFVCDGRALRRPLLLLALVECDGQQFLRGYTRPSLAEPVEEDEDFVGYIDDSVVMSQNWSNFQELARKMAEAARR